MISKLATLCMALLAGCSALSSTEVVRPQALPGMETIDVPGAQEESITPASSLPPDKPGDSDRLAQGDLIAISVYDEPDLSMELHIPASGEVNFPKIGKVQLAGKKIEEIEAQIKSRLEEKMLHLAQVTVLVKEYNKRLAYVHGSVKRSGAYEISFGRSLTLLQAISLAGGFNQDADRENMLLVRENGGKRAAYRIAYSDIVKRGSLEKDINLKDGDILIIQESGKVYVLGNVNRPGGFVFNANEKPTLTKVISLAGGFNAIAAQRSTTIIRPLADGGTRIFRINVGAIFSGSLRDPVLQPGDIVYVPESIF